MRPRAATKIAGSGRLWQGKLQVKPSHPRKVATMARFLPYCVRARVHNSLAYYVKLFIFKNFIKNRDTVATLPYSTTNSPATCPATTCHSCHFIDWDAILFSISVYNALKGV